MAIYVYHNPEFLEFYRRAGEGKPDLHRLYLAAIVETDEPEVAYRFTQHLETDWYNHPAVTTVVRSRSTSVGDVLALADGRLLAVAPFGFQELDAALPVEESALAQRLAALVAAGTRRAGASTADTAIARIILPVQALYTALRFALPLLERVAADVDGEEPYQALLARFALEQGRWALAQADGG